MSDFRGGYAGRFLRVNLDNRTVTVEDTPDVKKWLGPRGWNALIGWNEVGPGVGPFDPENRIVFSAGPLVGTGAPTAGRTTVSTLSPRGYPVPMWTSASMGGYWGAELKYAGYDGIVVQGQADAPCYLLIEDDQVSLRDASDLWGKGVFSTERALKAKHGGQHQIAAIGPAGENRVRFASIIHRLSNAVGNGGFGGVMGAKKLKAIVVRGMRGVPIADPAGFMDAVAYVWNLVKGGLSYVGQLERGYPLVACTHGCSVKCGTRIDHSPAKIVPDTPMRMSKCVNGSFVNGSHVGYRGVSTSGETLYIPSPPGFGEAGLDLGNLVEDLGMTAWCYDTWYRYLAALRELGIEEILGEPVALEDPHWWRDWIMDVAYRRGLGDDCAEGLARFYDKHEIGPRYLAEFVQSAGSRGHGWHRDGRSMEAHPSPYWEYSALLYAVSTRDVTPSTHGFFFLNMLYGQPDTPKAISEISPQLKWLAEKAYGSQETIYPGDALIERVAAWHQYRAIIKDSMGVCDWVYPVMRRTFDTQEAFEQALQADAGSLYGDLSAEAVLYRPCTGIDLDIAEMEQPIAERIVTLERCLEIRNHGRCREHDEVVIPHYQWSEKTDGTHISADASEFRALLDRYYTQQGWDKATGYPTGKKLEALGLGAVAEGMEKLGKLP